MCSESKSRSLALLNRDAAPFLPLLGTLFIFLVVANLIRVGARSQRADSVDRDASRARRDSFFVGAFLRRSHSRPRRVFERLSSSPNPVMLPFNILSELTRSFSLAMRLFGNIMSGELVVAIILALAGLLVPIPFMAFGILVGLVQAYIFSVLAAVYIGGGIGTIEK